MEQRIITQITRPSQQLIKELSTFDSATVHEASGGRGALESGIKPVDPKSRLCGPAITVSCRPGDNLMIHKAIYVAEKGDALIVTVGGFTEAGPWGEIMTVAAQVRGIAGLVMDGSIRDSIAIQELGFPAFSKGLSIKGTTKDSLGTINHPIVIGDVTVCPGDVVFGDADGVVIVCQKDLAEVLEKCKLRKEKEEKIKKELQMGKSTLELYGFDKILQAKGLKED
ncbi:MAG TPA: 4-carboxy-4-hydroxy-2-oxoadipate aldolase/oxaloacetate decarboxylase [Thermodesulfobacteriota bacterium]|nr:4-carboxy-4-hydroxy-2-oxoadipate aldolase/oxaloacetate decarboxylase [Thermodesulfobacteriota bacterium]